MARTFRPFNPNPMFKMGRKRPVACCPVPPATCDYTKAAKSAPSKVYGNETLGDCVMRTWSAF
jgi:hypothetical protein